MLVRHEDLLEDTKGWLHMLRRAYHLKAKPAFPAQVRTYKGKHNTSYVHHSEYESLSAGHGSSYWNPTTLRFLLDNVDLQLEKQLGYHYEQVLDQYI